MCARGAVQTRMMPVPTPIGAIAALHTPRIQHRSHATSTPTQTYTLHLLTLLSGTCDTGGFTLTIPSKLQSAEM